MIYENRLYKLTDSGTCSLEHALFIEKFDLTNLCDFKTFTDIHGNKIIQLHQPRELQKKVKYDKSWIDNFDKKFKLDNSGGTHKRRRKNK